MKLIKNGMIDVRMSLEELQLIYTLTAHINVSLGSPKAKKLVRGLLDCLEMMPGIESTLEEFDRLSFVSADEGSDLGYTEIVVEKEGYVFDSEDEE